jgi:Xaa-Pro dipeptidase
VRAHLDLLTDAMRDSGTDALMLGRPGNARWVTGADALWLSGSRSFAPSCVVVREPRSVHLLSGTDDGVPSDVVAPSNLFPISWNPMTLMGRLAEVPGLADAGRIGVDSITPTMEQLLGATFPRAQLVDGESVVRAVRRVKSDADVRGIQAAVELAEDCLARVVDAAGPGVRERELVGVFEARMASQGVTTPAFEGAFVVADGTTRSLVTDRELAVGDVLHARGGVLRDGWEGWLSRTTVCATAPTDAQRRAFGRWRAAMDSVLTRCRSGSDVADVRAAGATVDGVGMGHEELADGDVLERGMVLAIEVAVDDVLGSEVVVVGDDGCTLLTQAPHPFE